MTATGTATRLTAREVATDEDVEWLRQVHNSGNAWWTSPTEEITTEQQRAWWASWQQPHCRGNLRAWLYESGGLVVGAGWMHREEDRWWGGLGILPDYRGRGHGTDIYRHLAAVCAGDLWVEVRANNVASLRAAEKAGFGYVQHRLKPDIGALIELVARKEHP